MQTKLKTLSYAKLLALLLAMLVLDICAGAWFFKVQQQQQQQYVENQLTAIGNLKVKEITTWRQRLLDEGGLLTESPFFARGLEQYLENSELDNARGLLDHIRSMTTHYHYPGVLLVNALGKPVVSYGPFAQLGKNTGLETLVALAMSKRQAVLGDLFTDERVEGIFLAVAAPLFVNGQADKGLLGAIILVGDPEKFLFPLIQSWPIPSETAESLLVRADGDDVLYLNELRHRPGSAMKLRIPRSNLQTPAAMAVSGKTGIVQGIDYRGQKVLSHVQPIPGSTWFFVCKIDESEAFAAWRSQALLLIIAFSGIAALLIALGVAKWQRTRQKHYLQLFTAEQLLRQNAERSSVILKGIADGIIVTNNLGRIELLNPSAEELTGWRQSEALGKPLAEVFLLLDEKTGETVECSVTKSQHQGKSESLENRFLLTRKDSRKVFIANSCSPLHDDRGNIFGTVLVFRDQSKVRLMQRLTEKRLNISLYANNHSLEQLLTKVLDEICELVDSPIGFFHFVEEDQKTLALQQWSTRTLQEFCQAEGKGRHYDSALAGVWVDCLRERKPVVHNDYASLPHKKGLPSGHAPIIRELVVPVVNNDKVLAILGVGNKPVDYDDSDVETVAYLAEVVYHVIEAKRVEEQLQASLQTSDDLVRTIPSGLFIYQYHAPDHLVLKSGNPEAALITGKDIAHIIGLDFDTIWPEAKAQGITEHFLEVMRTGKTFETEDLHYADDQLVGAFRIRAFVLPGTRLAVAFENITVLKQSEAEKNKIQSQLQQALKMESVGRLAGGVAHDFNNMLSVILGNAEMALEHDKKDSAITLELQEIKAAALRSADLTRQLLAFARKQTVAPKVVNLNHAIEGMLKMLRRLIGEDVQLSWLPQTGLAPIFIDPSQIDQILANLCVNARDAIRGVGKIIIETGTVSLNIDYCRDNPGFVPGVYTLLSFSDNGSGIPKEHLDHIFEPFFTTKKQGEGTGLGLAMIYGIVKQNGGFIKVYSEAEQGTTFRIFLPQYSGETEDVERIQDLVVPQGQGELILLVEDETVILEMNTRMLKHLGYRVLASGSAYEAILLAEKHKDQLQILLTDIIMPEMNGHDLAKAILQTNPELKCLFMSGYTANVIAQQGFLPEGIHFLQKPFMKKDLAIKLHQVLGE